MAQKICTKCNNSCGTATKKCPTCGNEFSKKVVNGIENKGSEKPPLFSEKPPNLIQKENSGPGKGKKQCENCQTYVGIATRNCACGFSFVQKLVLDDDDEEFVKKINKRNCLICNTEYESEDYRIDEYEKIHYYYKYARYCSSSCLETSDNLKTQLVIEILELSNNKEIIINKLKQNEKLNSILTGCILDQKEAEEFQKYITERPKINFLSPQKRRLTSSLEVKAEGLKLPPEKGKEIINEESKKKSFLDLANEL